MCPPFTNPAAPALRPSGKSSTTAGTPSSPTTKNFTANSSARSIPPPSPPSNPSSAAATSHPASPASNAPIAATNACSPSPASAVAKGYGGQEGRHFCPACHQRRSRTIGDWIATGVCHEVPHRQFVFTIPKILRGIFRKRRHLLTHLFHTATETLRDSFRTRLNLPDGKLAAIAGVHTFGDYLIFHPHLHVLAADGLFDAQGRFHCMPAEDLAPAIELFRHRFLHALRDAKLISPKKLADLLSWKHSGFHIDNGGEKPVPAHDTAGRRGLAEYLLRHPFLGGRRLLDLRSLGEVGGEDPSLQKITWNATTKTVIYRSKRHHNTKRNFEIFKAPDFIAAALRFRAESFEWQAIGKPAEAKNALRSHPDLRSLGEEGRRRGVAYAENLLQI